MKIWDWVNSLTLGLKKLTDQSQQSYQQVYAYIDGQDKKIIDQLSKAIHDSIKLKSPNGTVYEISVENDGTINKKKVGE